MDARQLQKGARFIYPQCACAVTCSVNPACFCNCSGALQLLKASNTAVSSAAIVANRVSGACAAVLWWQGEERVPTSVLATALRRLHLAAQEGRCPLFALRPALAQMQSSPAPLRLTLAPAAQGQLAVTVFKRRGPAMLTPLQLMLPVAGVSVRRTLRRVAATPAPPVADRPLLEPGDAVVRTAPERIAA